MVCMLPGGSVACAAMRQIRSLNAQPASKVPCRHLRRCSAASVAAWLLVVRASKAEQAERGARPAATSSSAHSTIDNRMLRVLAKAARLQGNDCCKLVVQQHLARGWHATSAAEPTPVATAWAPCVVGQPSHATHPEVWLMRVPHSESNAPINTIQFI